MEQQILKEGERVVCVNSKPAQGQQSKLIEGKEYTVTEVFKCHCGEAGVSVGVKEDYFKTIRCKCGTRYIYKSERVYSQYRFVPVESNYQLEEEIFNSLKGHTILNDK